MLVTVANSVSKGLFKDMDLLECSIVEPCDFQLNARHSPLVLVPMYYGPGQVSLHRKRTLLSLVTGETWIADDHWISLLQADGSLRRYPSDVVIQLRNKMEVTDESDEV